MKLETYNLYVNGQYIKKATRVVLPSGEKIPFLEKVSKKEAIRNAKYQLELRRKKIPEVTPPRQ